VKRYCTDDAAAQPPVLVLPQQFLSRLPTTLPVTAGRKLSVALEKRQSWLDLARIVLEEAPEVTEHVRRSVDYLVRVGQGHAPPVNLQPLPWHETAKDPDRLRGADSMRSFPMILPVARFKAQLRN
jgi:hypothetical protein